jgi:GH25 family lysozyme M1 (1,4-beta-N-acetylmuramidase)
MSDEGDRTLDTTTASSADPSDRTAAVSTDTSRTDETTAQEASTPSSDAAPTDTVTSAPALSDPSDTAMQPQDAATTDGGSSTGIDTEDPGKPYLLVDLYSGDDGRLVGRHPDWQALVNTKGYIGAILKAWDGTKFNDGGWFKRHWPAVRDAGGDRYGKSWFRGAYLFLEFLQSGRDQADAYLQVIDGAGGWDNGDILPIIDVEQGGEGRPAANGKPVVPPHPNRKATKQQVIDCATECANRIREQTSRRVILYGRGAMRDLGINDRMGCDLVWNPAYTPTMVRHGLEAWNLEDIVLWQYCGDGSAAIASLPHDVPGFGACDISVFVKGSQAPTLQLVRENLLT